MSLAGGDLPQTQPSGHFPLGNALQEGDKETVYFPQWEDAALPFLSGTCMALVPP